MRRGGSLGARLDTLAVPVGEAGAAGEEDEEGEEAGTEEGSLILNSSPSRSTSADVLKYMGTLILTSRDIQRQTRAASISDHECMSCV